MDIGDLFGKAEDAAKQGMNDILKQGGNAALGFLEQKAIDVLSQDQVQKQQSVQSYVQNNLSGPPSPGSFGAYLGNILQSPVLKTYGAPMLIAIAIIAGGAIFIAKE